MRRRFAVFFVTLAAAAVFAPAAMAADAAPDQSDVDRCENAVSAGPSACEKVLQCATTSSRSAFCQALGSTKLSRMFSNRGAAYYFKGDYTHAIEDSTKAIAIDATNYVAYVGLGHSYRDQGDLDRALANFSEAVRLNPTHASNYHARGLVYIDKKDWDRAIAEFSRAIELEPDAVRPYYNRGVAYHGKGDLTRAVAELEHATAMNPTDDNARDAQVKALAELREVRAEVAKVAARPADTTTQQPVTATAEKRLALIIGNSAYQNVRRLDNPANDARLMADTLRALGFTLVGGGPQLDLDKIALDKLAQTFGRQLRGADVGLVYYAGHGVQIDGENYLVPVDANLVSKADVDFQMTNVQLLLRQMELSGTRLNLLILDACRNNPFGSRGLRDAGAGLAQMRAPNGTLIAFATAPGTAAFDSGGDANSPYAKALAEAMRRPELGLFDTFNAVAVAVQRNTGRAQEPWFSTSPIEGDSFHFVPHAQAAK